VSGQWSASPLQVSWALGSWDAHCGAKPSAQGDAGGRVRLKAVGAEFMLNGLGRNYSTTSCWEQLPGLGVRSHSASTTTIRTTCEMAKGDPRQATVVTTWALRGDKVYFDETGQYRFFSKDGACTASVRRTRLLSRIVEPSAPTTPDSQPPQAPPDGRQSPEVVQASSTENKCGDNERASRVELKLTTSLLRAGDPIPIEPRGYSRTGCPARATPRIEFLTGRELVEDVPDGFRVRPDAESGTIRLQASVDGAVAEAQLSVVSRREIEALFSGTSNENSALPAPEPRTHVGASSNAVSAPEPSRMPLVLGALGGLAASGLTLSWLLRRSAQRGKEESAAKSKLPSTSGQEVAHLPTPSTGRLPGGPPDVTPPGVDGHQQDRPNTRVCPICGERYSGSEGFCGKDGARLLREN
jgi:hypothetical protein